MVRRSAPIAACACLAALLTGCPADLENPDDYPAPSSGGSSASGGTTTGGSSTSGGAPATGGSSTTGGSTASGGSSASGGTGGTSSASCSTACATLEEVLSSCKNGCHNSANLGGLNLDQGDLDQLGTWIKDRPATHEGVSDASGCPSGDKLVDTATPGNSWLLKKVNGEHGTCGSLMPLGQASPNATTVECLTQWVDCLAGGG